MVWAGRLREATEFDASMLSRGDGGVASASSSRAASVAVPFQKLFLGVVDVGSSGGCVWALGLLGLQCFGIACASGRACASVSDR